MGTTKIQWADKVWNPVTGCTPISEGCANCYAARMAKRLAGRYGYFKDEPFQPTIHFDKLDEPLSWNRPQKVFVCSMGDLFHRDVDDGIIEHVFTTINKCPQHTFMILSKRPEKMREQIGIPLPNVWLGVTAENQRTADERIPILLQIPAAKRFVSVEPMLRPVNLLSYIRIAWQCSGCRNYFPDPYLHICPVCGKIDYWSGSHKFNPPGGQCGSGLDWVIAGPETGPGARPMSIDWLRDLQRQCAAADVPFFDKKDTLGETIQEWPR